VSWVLRIGKLLLDFHPSHSLDYFVYSSFLNSSSES